MWIQFIFNLKTSTFASWILILVMEYANKFFCYNRLKIIDYRIFKLKCALRPIVASFAILLSDIYKYPMRLFSCLGYIALSEMITEMWYDKKVGKIVDYPSSGLCIPTYMCSHPMILNFTRFRI